METQLAIEAGAADLGRHLQIQHPGKTAAMGVGGVVIAGPLHIQPHINDLQAVAARRPGAPALGRLAIDHVADPALAARQDHLAAQLLHRRLLGPELQLQGQLTGQLAGGIGAPFRRLQHLCGQLVQGRQ